MMMIRSAFLIMTLYLPYDLMYFKIRNAPTKRNLGNKNQGFDHPFGYLDLDIGLIDEYIL